MEIQPTWCGNIYALCNCLYDMSVLIPLSFLEISTYLFKKSFLQNGIFFIFEMKTNSFRDSKLNDWIVNRLHIWSHNMMNDRYSWILCKITELHQRTSYRHTHVYFENKWLTKLSTPLQSFRGKLCWREIIIAKKSEMWIYNLAVVQNLL